MQTDTYLSSYFGVIPQIICPKNYGKKEVIQHILLEDYFLPQQICKLVADYASESIHVVILHRKLAICKYQFFVDQDLVFEIYPVTNESCIYIFYHEIPSFRAISPALFALHICHMKSVVNYTIFEHPLFDEEQRAFIKPLPKDLQQITTYSIK